MGLSGCCKIVKYMLIFINFLFWIAGFAALAVFVWVLTDPSVLISMTQDENHFYIGLYMFLVAGLLMIVIAFIGCCGSCKESECMLISFFCCLLIVLVAEIAAGAWAYHNNDKLDEMVRSSVKNTVQNEYSIIESKTAAFDTFQIHFECCGANGPNDWATSKFNNMDKSNILNMEISRRNSVYQIPESCCKANTDRDICNVSRGLHIASIVNPVIHNQGCMDKLVAAFHDNITIVIAIVIAIIVIELFGLIFSIMLCCTIKNNNHYKA